MTLPEQERERFCQVLHHSRTSLYRLAFSITRNSSDAQEAVAEAVCRAYERYPQLREKEKLPRWLLKMIIFSRAPGAPVPKAGTPNAQQAVPYFAALSFTHSSGMALAAASLVGSHLPDFSRVR